LRTAESTGAEGTVRATIDHTRQMLEKVDYRRLSTVRKKAYDDAKRFAQQAEDALKAGNTTFAQGVAAKGETLARELAGG
jgi:phage shock protein A